MRATRQFAAMAIAVCIAAWSFEAAAMMGKDVVYEVDGQPYEGYYVGDGTAPLVLLIHDWDGLTDYEKRRAGMLHELGYSVFAVDLFGKGVRPTEVTDKRQHTGELYKDRAKMRRLMQGGLDKAKALGLGDDRTVAMGYCFGGAAVLELARSGAPMSGFVSFHGGLGTPDGQNYADVKAPIMVLHGTADAAISMDDFANLAKRLEAEKVNHEMVTYSGAPHAFTVFGSQRYRQDADEKSWQAFTRFLKDQTL